MFKAIYQEILAHDTIILHRHSRPDGDAMGSQIGMKAILRENFPEKKVYVVVDEAGFFSFMDECVMDEIPDETYADALARIYRKPVKASYLYFFALGDFCRVQ